MRRYTTDEEKKQIMVSSGILPLHPFQNKDSPWLSQCLICSNLISPTFKSIRRGEGGCKFCAGRAINELDAIKTFNDSELEPLIGFPGSNKPWKSRCLKCKRVVTPTYSNVKNGHKGCKHCSKIVSSEKKKIQPSDAEKTMLAVGLKPLVPYTSSKTPWTCECLKCGRIVSPQYSSALRGSGCIFCAGKKVDELEAKEFMISKGIIPSVKFPGSNRKWKSKCSLCKRQVSPTYSSVLSGSGGCTYCGGKKVDLREVSQVMKKAGIKPLVKFPGSASKWKSECLNCTRIVYPSYSNVRNGHSGCVYCSGKKVDEKVAMLAMKVAHLKPQIAFPGASKPWKCICQNCKQEVSPSYKSIRRGGGCKYCAEIGIDYLASGYLYLMTNPIFGAHKIGIGNSYRARKYNDRIKQHQKEGWILHYKLDVAITNTAFEIEQEVLNWLFMEKKLGIFLSKEEMPQGGYTETIDASEIDLSTIWAKVEQLSKVKK